MDVKTCSTGLEGILPQSSPQIQSQDERLVKAFRELDIEKTLVAIQSGANPNQKIPLSKAIIEKLMRTFPQKFNANKAFSLDTEEGIELFSTFYLEGVKTLPLLFLAGMLKYENLAIELVNRGADLAFTLPEGDGNQVKMNLLDVAAIANIPNLAEYLVRHTELSLIEKSNVDSPAPFMVAFEKRHLEVLEVFLKLCQTELASLSIEDGMKVLYGLWESENSEIGKLFEKYDPVDEEVV